MLFLMVGKREERLLEDEDVRRWFETMSRFSPQLTFEMVLFRTMVRKPVNLSA